MRQTACLVINQSLLMAMLHSVVARRRFGPQTQCRPFRKLLTRGFELDDMSGLARRGSAIGFSFTLAHSRISHEYSSFFFYHSD